jgi:hypothetical protein
MTTIEARKSSIARNKGTQLDIRQVEFSDSIHLMLDDLLLPVGNP